MVDSLAERYGLSRAYLSTDEHPVAVLDDLLETNAPYLFDKCSDVEAKLLLECFLLSTPPCEWELDCQLARLAATRGQLVLADAIAVIDQEDWTGINPRQLLLSFIVTFPDFKTRLSKLLANSLPDFRDGLFIACKFANDPEADLILRAQFEKWSRSKDWPVAGTGEAEWLSFFTKKWRKETGPLSPVCDSPRRDGRVQPKTPSAARSAKPAPASAALC